MGASPSAPLPKEGAKTLLRNFRISEKEFVWYKDFGVKGKLTDEESWKLAWFMTYNMAYATKKLLEHLSVDGCVMKRDIVAFGPLVHQTKVGPLVFSGKPNFAPSGSLSVSEAKATLSDSRNKDLVERVAESEAWKLAKIPKTRKSVTKRLGTLKRRCKRNTPFYISINIIPIAEKTRISHRNLIIVNPTHNTVLWIEPGALAPYLNEPAYEKGFRDGILEIAGELGLRSPKLIEPDLADGEKLYKKMESSAAKPPKGWTKTSGWYKFLTGRQYYSETARISVKDRPRSTTVLPQTITKDANCTFWTYFILLHLLLNPSLSSPKEVIEAFYNVYDSQSKGALLEYIGNFKFFLYHKLFGAKIIERLNQA